MKVPYISINRVHLHMLTFSNSNTCQMFCHYNHKGENFYRELAKLKVEWFVYVWGIFLPLKELLPCYQRRHIHTPIHIFSYNSHALSSRLVYMIYCIFLTWPFEGYVEYRTTIQCPDILPQSIVDTTGYTYSWSH